MSLGHWIALGVFVALFALIGAASYFGWGMTSDAQAEIQARHPSVAAGSLHRRQFYGGGPSYGK